MSAAQTTAAMSDCTQMRRKLVTRSTLNMATGATKTLGSEWMTEPCNAPLFGRSMAIGKCPACEVGWTHEHNYPVGDAALAAAKTG